MTTKPGLMPTITHRVRSFLQAQGARVVPWSGLEETYAELYRLLRDRREDPSLWPGLAELLREVVSVLADRTAAQLAAPSAELLASWDIEALIRELRAALPSDDDDADGGGAIDRFLSGLKAPVLGGFLLIGLIAAGCGGQTTGNGRGGEGNVTATGGTTGSAGSPSRGTTGSGGSPSGGTTGGGGSPSDGTGGLIIHIATGGRPPSICDGGAGGSEAVLERAITQSSTLVKEEKDLLCTCFAQLNASWSDGLVRLFETGTDEEIVRALEEMLECCTWTHPDTFVMDRFLDGSLCTIARPYKGVSFPRP